MSSERGSRPVRPVGSDEFRRACGRFATGVSVATALDGKGIPHGLTVSSFTSVSLHPPLILICLGHAVKSIEVFRSASHFGINVLHENQQDLSQRFATRGLDRFDGVDWLRGETGVPLIPGAVAQMECVVRKRVIAGDHDIFIAEMVASQVNEGDPLLYYASAYRRISAE